MENPLNLPAYHGEGDHAAGTHWCGNGCNPGCLHAHNAAPGAESVIWDLAWAQRVSSFAPGPPLRLLEAIVACYSRESPTATAIPARIHLCAHSGAAGESGLMCEGHFCVGLLWREMTGCVGRCRGSAGPPF